MAVSQITLLLFVSDLNSALNEAVLRSRNIKLIVNASNIQGVTYPQIPGLEVVHVPVQDVPHAPLDQYFALVSERIHHSITQGQACLLHCVSGRSRSPALVIAYVMRFLSLSLVQAHVLVQERRPFIHINAGFWRQLLNYELLLRTAGSDEDRPGLEQDLKEAEPQTSCV
ncbi:unnamed protein product [Knipowitschia caucasica]|uniref:Protein-tyrosine-phosphatase n=1 Tax=Knipowitschia caucasica TaxID=637954 RepID=A0AAV2J5V8_KNICA